MDNERLIKQLIDELVLQPRLNAIEWSKITKQTPNIKIGYPGQHLASLITGMTGERTGARGNDLIDGSEVKSCSRIDQLDICKNCSLSVARVELECSHCGSKDIERKNDSKWLFTIRNESDLEVLIHEVNRVVLLIGDYPNFDSGDFETLRFQAFEIWPEEKRHKRFAELMTNYYRKIYLSHRKKTPDQTPAPKNFWPYSYQFFISNPIRTFLCIVENANTKPKIRIEKLVAPSEDRSKIKSERMPIETINDRELKELVSRISQSELNQVATKKITLKEAKKMPLKTLRGFIEEIPENLREYLELRDTDKISSAKKKYSRRKNS
ncbi:MAG: MamI restriction endonuclease [Candidatus Wolfebacteria bacterium GW2011_GWC1_37_10]|uniref:MamI restriction endonuclease n=1 Tax=Candidatus Wolfebacteria bacterium GW2011_GWC1_37_10 TaxID=1619010 RepID=A0A0G0FVJ6_9BACT|nr:MAG: MamI restriction endonuclease [Candidatus Wolfebacteria bacterium GW2011_GWC1_37_10]